MSNVKSKSSLTNRNSLFVGLRSTDVVMFVLLALGSILLYQCLFDMYISVKHAEDLIELTSHGKFFQFYDFVMQKAVSGEYGFEGDIFDSAYYNIFLYLVLAVIILPWYLFSKITSIAYRYFPLSIYIKTILLLMVGLASYLIYRTCKVFSVSEKRAKSSAILFLTSSIVMFSSVGFNQLDVFYVLVLILALEQYAQRHLFKFALLMSVAIMLKSFPLAIFIPLILLVEKKPIKILEYLLAGISAPIINSCIFNMSDGYVVTQKTIGSSFGFTNSIFARGIEGGLFPISLLIVAMVFICTWAYTVEINDSYTLFKTVAFLGTSVYGLFFVFVFWHTQWGIILALFTSLLLPHLANTKLAVYIDTALSLSFLVSAYVYNPTNMYMLNNAILPKLTNKALAYDLFGGEPINNVGVITFSVFSACIFELMFWGYKAIKNKTDENDCALIERTDYYLRMAPLMLVQICMIVVFMLIAS